MVYIFNMDGWAFMFTPPLWHHFHCFCNLLLFLLLHAVFVIVPHPLKHCNSLDMITNPPTHCAITVILKPYIIHELCVDTVSAMNYTAFPPCFLLFYLPVHIPLLPLPLFLPLLVHCNFPSSSASLQLWREMESSDDDTLSERSCASEPSFRSERSGGSLSPCPSGLVGLPGDTLPWNLSKHERRKRKSQNSVLDPAERAVVRVAGKEIFVLGHQLRLSPNWSSTVRLKWWMEKGYQTFRPISVIKSMCLKPFSLCEYNCIIMPKGQEVVKVSHKCKRKRLLV